ncbi:MAP kinase phosphatase with leucine-rich repeats protein 2 isoform X4 [Manis pentadactyla]|uniref:MAP kinase phosphatase with leucine-rich repeats protein 2 isoform X4 n=1 Tax=Manis pentadactyla TaxID=143292 RepID=UPI00255CC87E|nr:MAP kinase phosphatase with leucine-rich repeats protein 2 isoform X4 [Manis pentadactyla]
MAEASLPELRGDAEATPCPSVLELEELLRAGKVSCSRVDEVWPNLYIGDAATANNRFELWKLGITHVLNAAHGGLYCQGSPDFYGSSVTYLGVPAHDLPDFDISAYFSSAADFIHRALSTPGALPAGPAASGCSPDLGGQGWPLVPATGLCHFTSLALVLLALLAALAQVDTKKMKQHQVCRDRQLEAGSTECPSEKTTASVRYPHRMDSLQKQDLRRPKIHRAVRELPYQPPTLAALQRLLWVRRAATPSHINEVWPSLFLGDAYAARDKNKLAQLGITHIVNVAAGKFQVDTGAKFYRGMPLAYYGIEADDNPFFDLSVYFLPVARYIRTALSVSQGRVLVHCAMGVSRSATVVLAFLMICENMTLVEAIQVVQAHRNICPNSGFLRQLQVLDNRLGRETGRP